LGNKTNNTLNNREKGSNLGKRKREVPSNEAALDPRSRAYKCKDKGKRGGHTGNFSHKGKRGTPRKCNIKTRIRGNCGRTPNK